MDKDNTVSTNPFVDGINVESLRNLENTNKITKGERIVNARKKLTQITPLIAKRPEQIEFQKMMGKLRVLPPSLFHIANGFYIPNFEYNNEIFHQDLMDVDLGLRNEKGNPIFSARFVYPIFGFDNEVLGYIGYDNESDIKYLLSSTLGFGKSNTFYGMHMMRWIYSKGYIIVVEGIVDCLWLWSKGYPAIALQGNHLTAFVKQILLRFGMRVIFIPDNDETGLASIKYWLKDVPEASVIYITDGSDTDAWRRKITKNMYEGNITEEFMNERLGLFDKAVSHCLYQFELNIPAKVRILEDELELV